MSRVAVITGSAHGLGSELAKHFAKNGYNLALTYLKSKDTTGKLAIELKKTFGVEVRIYKLNAKSEAEVNFVFAKIIKDFGKIDLLVNNVGNFLYKPFTKTTNSEFADIIESNIYSTLFCSRAALVSMKKNKSGQIINIGAVGSERFVLRENSIPYFLAKNGVYILTKTLAYEEAKNGIHVNMVSPGSMKEDIFKKSDFPMGRVTKFADVIGAIDFLTSKEAYYINGCNIEVSGGFVPGMK